MVELFNKKKWHIYNKNTGLFKTETGSSVVPFTSDVKQVLQAL